ncbi:ABC transporter permease [Streptomyces sp. NPDC086549]|uniref:ABC transporter permease n=1 Tax=Streptomyces sp. NPDC086549 TaxID=3365752 RepID=UPI0037F9AFAC
MYFVTATRMALTEHARNRLALWLVALYLPIWLTLSYLMIPAQRVRYVLRAPGETLWAQGNELSQISGALNAVTQIVGFMMFSVTFNTSAFDRRLALAGYPRTYLVTAKTCVLITLSALISGYATTAMTLFWHQQRPAVLALSIFLAAITYGALGVLLGTLVRGELEGMFLILMISIADVGLQNPIANHAADNGYIRVLPIYGAMQAATAGGFSTTTPLTHLALQLTWFAALTALGLIVFHRNTRDRSPRPGDAPDTLTEHSLPAA